jgi:proteasome lid subunit RPN8/RPN11
VLRLFLTLKQIQISLLIDETNQHKPIEACALLFGKSLKNGFLVKEVIVAPNILNSEVEFEIDPQLFIAELEKADAKGQELVGFFHSHPAPAYPSGIDLKNMKLWPNTFWLIFSSVEKKMAAYLLNNNVVEELQLRIESK